MSAGSDHKMIVFRELAEVFQKLSKRWGFGGGDKWNNMPCFSFRYERTDDAP